jgi:hypothetical protein
MIEYLKLLVETIGHIIWPVFFLIIFWTFKKELKSLLSRLKSAEIKDFKIELTDKIDDIKKEAINYGVTMFYPSETIEREFNPSKNEPFEWQIIESWKNIEDLIEKLDERQDSKNIMDSINYLAKANIIEKYLANLVLDLRELRNIAAHKTEMKISNEEFQNWMSISKSVIDRLKSKIKST